MPYTHVARGQHPTTDHTASHATVRLVAKHAIFRRRGIGTTCLMWPHSLPRTSRLPMRFRSDRCRAGIRATRLTSSRPLFRAPHRDVIRLRHSVPYLNLPAPHVTPLALLPTGMRPSTMWPMMATSSKSRAHRVTRSTCPTSIPSPAQVRPQTGAAPATPCRVTHSVHGTSLA